MRDRPEELKGWVPYDEPFDPMAFGRAEGRFQLVTETYGDGDSFRWTAGGGEEAFKVTRVARGYSRDEKRACSKWELQKFSQDGQLIDTFTVDPTVFELRDREGDLLSQHGVNEVDRILVDLDYEMKHRNPQTAFLLAPVGHTGRLALLFNRGFEGVGINDEELGE